MRVSTHFALWLVGLAKAETQTSENERAFLAESARGLRRVAEIGVWHGVTTARLKTAMSPEGILYAIDPFSPGRLGFSMQAVIAKRSVRRVRGCEVRWVRLPSEFAAAHVLADGLLDLVFIDGVHTYEALALDWNLWSAGIAPNGLVALHDSASSSERPIEDAGSVKYTKEHICFDARYSHVGTVDTLTLWRRLS